MKRIFTLILPLLFTLLISVSPVFAHVLLTDGSIGATLHIDPEDDPIVGQPSNFYFEFKDKQNLFDPNNCDCRITITSNGQKIYDQELFNSSVQTSDLNSPVFTYTFPEKNIYLIKITGTPKTPNAFTPFNLEHSLRIDREASAKPQTQNSLLSDPHFFHYIAAALAVLAFTVILFLDRRNRGKNPPKTGKKILSLILALALVVPILYTSTHFNHDHKLIGNHDHPCCFVSSQETANAQAVTTSTISYLSKNNQNFASPDLVSPKAFFTRAPPPLS